ncbi:MAG: hypothetical protein ACLT2T_15170 [Bilophila wadsworthia]
MRELGSLYAMLANKGVWQHPRLYEGEAVVPPCSAVARGRRNPAYAGGWRPFRQVEEGLSRCASRPEPPTVPRRVDGRRVGPYVLVVWVGISTIRRTRCLWAAMWRLLCSVSRRRWRPTPGRSMISFPFNRKA